MAKRILFRDGKIVFRDGKIVFVEEGQAGECECCDDEPCTCPEVGDWSAKQLAVDIKTWDYETTAGPQTDEEDCDNPERGIDYQPGLGSGGIGFWHSGTLAFVEQTAYHVLFQGTLTTREFDLFDAYSNLATPPLTCGADASVLEPYADFPGDATWQFRWNCALQVWQRRPGTTGTWLGVTQNQTEVVIFYLEDDFATICQKSTPGSPIPCGGGTACAHLIYIDTWDTDSIVNDDFIKMELVVEDAP